MKSGKKISIACMVFFTLLLTTILFIYSKIHSKSIENTAVGIIGGADGPTQIYISSDNDKFLVVGVIIVIVSVLITIFKVYTKLRKR